jgi:hypothetical protein
LEKGCRLTGKIGSAPFDDGKDIGQAMVLDGAPKTANQIVALIGSYYQANADEIEKPVIAVLWDVMIKPNIVTGIAGWQLKP